MFMLIDAGVVFLGDSVEVEQHLEEWSSHICGARLVNRGHSGKCLE